MLDISTLLVEGTQVIERLECIFSVALNDMESCVVLPPERIAELHCLLIRLCAVHGVVVVLGRGGCIRNLYRTAARLIRAAFIH